MSQTDTFYIENMAGAPFRNLLNQILAALSEQNSGSTEPAKKFAGMVWLDTSSNPSVFKLRNDSNTGWITIFTDEHPPTKEQVGLKNVPNYSATSSLTDGSATKFLLAAAGKELNDNKLNKTGIAYDSARLGNVLASQYVLISGTYANLRAQATTKADVDLGSVENYGITSSLTSNNSSLYLSAKGGYDLNQAKVNKTTTINGKKLDSNITLTAANVGAFPANGGNLTGAINYTLTTGDIITLGGKALLRRISSAGGASFGCDDALILGCGEARQVLEDNVSATTEELHLGSDGAVKVYTNLQSGWASRKEFEYEKDGGFKVSNAAKTRQNLDVPSVSEARRFGRVIGEIVEFGFDEYEPGFLILDGVTRVPGGMLDPDYQVFRDRCLGKYIFQEGDDFVVADAKDFRRGKGSSSRSVGQFEKGVIGSHKHVSNVPLYTLGNASAFFPFGKSSYTTSQIATTAANSNATRGYTSTTGGSQNTPDSTTVLVAIFHGVGI